jgi:hypothetical protein
MVLGSHDPAMEMACARLADAEIRIRNEDRIVDAVIGMEAILLAGIDKEDRRGELSFRFALNYSTLFESPQQKQHAYKEARDLYSLRSVIAHGSTFDPDKLKIAGVRITPEAAGKKATSVLRNIVTFFLPMGGAPYKSPAFWQGRYFGLPDSG